MKTKNKWFGMYLSRWFGIWIANNNCRVRILSVYNILNESVFNTDYSIIWSGDCCMMWYDIISTSHLLPNCSNQPLCTALLLLINITTEKFVSCGSAIKLTHVESGGNYILRSDERQLQSGSGVSIRSF